MQCQKVFVGGSRIAIGDFERTSAVVNIAGMSWRWEERVCPCQLWSVGPDRLRYVRLLHVEWIQQLTAVSFLPQQPNQTMSVAFTIRLLACEIGQNIRSDCFEN